MLRLLRQALILPASLLVCASLAYAQAEPDGEQRRIRQIRIYLADPYTEEQAAESSWASFTNRFHITTRESVVRNKLLFKEGDVLDEELLEASERSLRVFKFLNTAEVSVVPVDEQNVDVEVHTRDAWSLTPGLDIKGGGGLATVSVHLMELNLLGHGKKLFVEATNESDVGTTMKYGYSDYQLFGSRWVGITNYKNGPLVESFFVTASRPLYSPDSKWAFGSSAYVADKIIRRFEDGEESDRFAEDQVQLGAYVKRSYGERFQKFNLKLEINYKTADYSALGAATTEPLPRDIANLTPSVSIDKENIKWEKFTYLNKMGITEDNWLGVRYGGKLGYGIPLEDGFELWDTRLWISNNTAFSHKQLLKLKIDASSEVVRNTVVSAAARYYKKFSRHTVATRFSTKLGNELDSTRQFKLGADSGLRGYPARQFTGERLILVNLEDRQFWGEVTIGPRIAVGTVLFVDAGNVWKEEEDIDLDELNWSTGFGFRLGFSNLPKQPIFRIDFGWAIDSETDDNFAVTIGQEQQF
jgi:hypothetical protein